MASSKSSQQTEDFFSNVPDILTDKILEYLPIQIVARISVLSKHWRCQNNEDGSCNWQECSNIISSILFHHNGPVHEFNLYIPEGADEQSMNLSQWLSFLSKNAVRRITLCNWFEQMPMPSYIFWCSELVHLELDYFVLNPPPTGFTGFPKLQHLSLIYIKFTQQDSFLSLIAKCPVLSTLTLKEWTLMSHVIIDAPSLETLTVIGQFESLAFRDVRNLKSISVHLKEQMKTPMTIETFDAFNLLASLCQLQCIQFEGNLCKSLAAGSKVSPLPAFNHLNKLCLNDLDLDELHVLDYVFGMVRSCPYIKELEISVITRENSHQHEFQSNKIHKLDHLLEVNIRGITGSSAELKLIEYLLAVSGVLEKLVFECGDTESELKMSRSLMAFPRASPKARLVCLT